MRIAECGTGKMQNYSAENALFRNLPVDDFRKSAFRICTPYTSPTFDNLFLHD